MNLYSIYDLKANEYGPVFEAKNDAVACRMCKNEFGKVPKDALADYVLYQVGEFSHDIGCVAEYKNEVCDVSDVFPAEEVKQ